MLVYVIFDKIDDHDMSEYILAMYMFLNIILKNHHDARIAAVFCNDATELQGYGAGRHPTSSVALVTRLLTQILSPLNSALCLRG